MFFRKKTTLQKLNKANLKMTKAFSVFQKALEKVEKIQLKLLKSVSESEERVELLQSTLNLEIEHQRQTKDAIAANEELKAKLQEFSIK